jgi:hypothetical protein
MKKTTETFDETAQRLEREAKNSISVFARPATDDTAGPWLAIVQINGIDFVSREFARGGAEGLRDRAQEAFAEIQTMAVTLNRIHPALDAAATPVRVDLGDAIDDLEISVMRQLELMRERAGIPPKNALVLTADSIPTVRRALGAFVSDYEGNVDAELADHLERARAYIAHVDAFFDANPMTSSTPLPTSAAAQGVDCPMCEDHAPHRHVSHEVGSGG